MTKPDPQDPSDTQEDPAAAQETGPKPGAVRRRGRGNPDDLGFERIAEVHYCRSDEEANQYLALGPEWDLQDILPMRVETEDGGILDEVHFIVARWENDRDRERLRSRDHRLKQRRSS
jgi:hypothetical protein